MTVQLLAFTAKGFALAKSLAASVNGQAARCKAPLSLDAWTARSFAKSDALVYVGAVGIAVRAIAPYIRSKTTDPAVVVVDECGHFAVSLLSGHLGGANDLTRRIAAVCGAVPVITTATDANGVFAVDEWAKYQNCAVVNSEKIKFISAELLAGGNVLLYTDWPITGQTPQGVTVTETPEYDISLTIRREDSDALHLVPRIAVVGIGCKRGTPQTAIENAYDTWLAQHRIYKQAVIRICSIDLKQDEPGLTGFCRARSLPFQTFSAEQLQQVQGNFTTSAFVQNVTGVDNVCERSAVLGSGGTLYLEKTVHNGVTLAMALAPFAPNWQWRLKE